MENNQDLVQNEQVLHQVEIATEENNLINMPKNSGKLKNLFAKNNLIKIVPIIVAAVTLFVFLGIYFTPEYLGAKKLTRVGAYAQPSSSAALNQKYVAANQKLGLALLEQQESNQNALVSPVSLFTVLSLCFAGGENQTYDQFSRAFDLNTLSKQELVTANKNAVEMICNTKEGVTTDVANSIWYDKPFEPELLPQYISMAQDSFYADLFAQDFSNRARLVKNVNKWASKNTDGMVKEAIKEDQLNDDSVMVLANALLFEGAWNREFAKTNNKEMSFYAPTQTVQATYMYKAELAAFANDSVEAVRIPYKDSRFSMIAAKPKKGMQALLQDTQTMIEVFTQSNVQARIYLPKFEFDYKATAIKDTLRDMGIQNAFNPAQADFGGMSTQPLYLSEVGQASAIKVDEKGTKAAAVTIVIPGATSAGPSETIEIIFDEPFFFGIMFEDLPLFCGVLYNPKA